MTAFQVLLSELEMRLNSIAQLLRGGQLSSDEASELATASIASYQDRIRELKTEERRGNAER